MKIIPLIFILLSVSACKFSSNTPQTCYGVTEPHLNSKSWLLFDKNNQPMPSITVLEETNGETIIEEALGRFENNKFIYADGAYFEINDLKAIGHGGLIEGLIFTKTSCPDLKENP